MNFHYLHDGKITESTSPLPEDVEAIYLTPIEYQFAKIINANPSMSLERMEQALREVYRLVHLGETSLAESD